MSDSNVPDEDRLEASPGWFYPTRRMCVVVDRVLNQYDCPETVAGDTVCFRYPTSVWAVSQDNPDLGEWSSAFEIPEIDLKTEESGVFALRFTKNGEFRTTSQLVLTDEEVKYVEEFVSSFEPDSIAAD